MTEDFERSLGGIALAPYIVKATALIGVQRRAGSNMFRHQISTMGILIDYKIIDAVLLKAALIHDLFEKAPHLPGATEAEIARIDSDGSAVYGLVQEVTIRIVNGTREPKSEYLLRVMQSGSERAKLLKLADRISNLTALGYVHELPFIETTVRDTREYVLPFAEGVNPDMFRELSDLVASRQALIELMRD